MIYKTLIVFLSLIVTTTSFAQDTSAVIENVTESGNVVTLNIGESAPFAGTLSDVPATAKIITELRTSKIKCQAEIDRNHQIDKADFSLKLNECAIRLNTEIQKNEQILKVKNEQIKKLEDINVAHLTHNKSEWWEAPTATFSYGMILGTGLSLLGIYMYTR